MRELRHPRVVYSQLMDLLARLAAKGLIHCDFNEFNLLARACLFRAACKSMVMMSVPRAVLFPWRTVS